MTERALARVQWSLAQIAARDGLLHACTTVRRDGALAEALDSVAEATPGRARSLLGWTIAVKDNTDVAGTIRSDGLGPPHPQPAASDAAAVARLRAAGAAIVAKANLEQLSFGATTQNDYWGACRNPWDPTRIPGGSSGGSAVAVAAGFVDAALGTDTGGSLRNPAAFCGVSALRPTHGAVPVDGVTPLAPSFDVVGPIARSAAELRALLAVLSPSAEWSGGPASDGQPLDLRAVRVGIPQSYFFEELDAGVARGLDAVIDLLRAHGAQLRVVTLPDVTSAAEAAAVRLNVEAAVSLRDWWDDPRLTPGIRERIALGRTATGADRSRAATMSDAWRATVARAFDEVDVILTPATPFPAPPIDATNLVALSRAINRCNQVWSLIGLPALVIPVAPTPGGLPVGAQLIAPAGGDPRLLAIGEAIQALSDWHLHTPTLRS